ncbi:FecR family protein [Roseateles cellulosilyticus]|uniref:FecR domain-containing protein n=1 Tax=Pelomonas cellulosilytica TaxID=2906762 RepID=A0ABS8Y2P5_9BURK|nr:FecR domain-containing protein [Pelomonas sp. P8]MCE4558018.1 FecR domain-containing protein [Pelomonas sp. P8]
MSRFESGADDRQFPGDRVKVTPEIAAEAAAWIASLHGPDRSPEMEDDFRAWQRQSPVHREAFEKMTDVWQAIPGTQAAKAFVQAAEREKQKARRARSAAWRWAGAAALGVFITAGVFTIQQWRDRDLYTTSVGEQRSVVLDDGTRMLLNTATQARVEFGSKQRTVKVTAGEALFEVAKDASRPFVVRVAGSEVVAVGTMFSVRFTDSPTHQDALTVTLVEGQVNVRPADGGGDGLRPLQAVALKPGDRLTLRHDASPASSDVAFKVDRPNIERAMAWQRREAAFDGASLPDVIAEFNRYSRTQIVLSEEVRKENYVVSGIYRTGDNAAFANSLSMLYGLKVREIDGRLELEKIR